MKTSAYWLPIIVLLIAMTFSCEVESIRPSGDIVTLTPNITGFDALSVSDDFKVFVTFSEGDGDVRLEVDDNVADRVVVEKSGTTLVIKLEGSVNTRGNLRLEAYVTAEYLDFIKANGDAEVTLENELTYPKVEVDLAGDSKFSGAIQTDRLTVELSGDSKMEMTGFLIAESVNLDIGSDSEFTADLDTEDFIADLRGDSKVFLSGDAITADIEASGDSEIEDFGFSIQRLDIDLKSDSKATLTVTESIRVKASGDSVLEYKGNAAIDVLDLSGDSKVINAN